MEWNAVRLDARRYAPSAGSGTGGPARHGRGTCQGSAAELREAGFELPEQIGATFLGDAAYLNASRRRSRSLVDDYPRRLFLAGRAVHRRRIRGYYFDDGGRRFRRASILAERNRHSRCIAVCPSLMAGVVRNETLPFFDHQNGHQSRYLGGRQPAAITSRSSISFSPGRLPEALALWMLGSDDVQQNIAEFADDPGGQVDYVIGVRALSRADIIRVPPITLHGQNSAASATRRSVRCWCSRCVSVETWKPRASGRRTYRPAIATPFISGAGCSGTFNVGAVL